jgi:sugar-specific transcriptional regulator TrmB
MIIGPSMHIRDSTSEPVIGLEEFCLSRYEAQAYVTMIVRGSLSASEIAYYSDLPRTKVYPILKKLAKKNPLFVVLSRLKKHSVN